MSKTKKDENKDFLFDDKFTADVEQWPAREVEPGAEPVHVAKEILLGKVCNFNNLPDRNVLIFDDGWRKEYFRTEGEPKYVIIETATGTRTKFKVQAVVFDQNRVDLIEPSNENPRPVFDDRVYSA